jgi:hypothetical protein
MTLALSNKWAPVLAAQRETGMGYQIASIFLKDGRKFDRVVIIGGFITSIDKSPEVPFADDDIDAIVATHDR